MQKIIISGNIVTDLKLVELDNSCVVNFTVSVREGHKQKDGTWKNRYEYFNCEAFDTGAQVIVKNFEKGDAIELDAVKRDKKYEKDGATKYYTAFRVNSFNFVPSKFVQTEEPES